MACTLSNSGISTLQVIRAAQVSQSIDAFTKAEAYDITISGSLTVTGSLLFSGSNNLDLQLKGIPSISQTNVLTYNNSTGIVGYVAASSFVPQPSVSPYETGSKCVIFPIDGDNQVTGSTSVIGGGANNKIFGSSISNGIQSGLNNVISSSFFNNQNYIGGGNANKMCNYNLTYNSILGGFQNKICGDINNSTGGSIQTSVIVGGDSNIISGSGNRTVIVGGLRNCIIGCQSSPTSNVIVGGNDNSIKPNCLQSNFIGAGDKNTIDPTIANPSCDYISNAVIVAGCLNTGSCHNTFIAAGCCNYACHEEAFILGSCITSCAACTTHVNNLNVGCTTQMQLRDPLGTGQAGMLTACDAGGGAAELYFHDGTSYKKVCLVP
mgnify:CR=1 FL=1